MKKYTFSTISHSYGEWSWERRDGLTNKYYCQVFNEDGSYAGIIIKDTYNEVVEEQKRIEKEGINNELERIKKNR